MRRYLLCKGRPLVVLYSVLIFNGHPVPQFLQAQPLPICRQTQVQFQVLFYFSYIHIIQISNLQNFATPLSSLSPAQEYCGWCCNNWFIMHCHYTKKEKGRRERGEKSTQLTTYDPNLHDWLSNSWRVVYLRHQILKYQFWQKLVHTHTQKAPLQAHKYSYVHFSLLKNDRTQELRQSWGGCLGFPIPNNPHGLCGRKATLNNQEWPLPLLS